MNSFNSNRPVQTSHRSQSLTRAWVDWADTILTTSLAPQAIGLAQMPALAPQLQTFTPFAGLADSPDIDAPVRSRINGYRGWAA